MILPLALVNLHAIDIAIVLVIVGVIADIFHFDHFIAYSVALTS